MGRAAGSTKSDELTVVEKAMPLGLMLVVMWLAEIADRILPGDLQANGIHPRELDGLFGIATSPFLHTTWGHLVANSGPFLILGALVLLRGLARWATVTVFVIVVGGAFTWLVGGGGNHIGASGVVFGYFGALIGAAVFERNVRSAAPALVAALLYSTLLFGLIPRAGLSWEGHLGGLLAGLAVAKIVAAPRPVPEPEPPIRGDEYWLVDGSEQ